MNFTKIVHSVVTQPCHF